MKKIVRFSFPRKKWMFFLSQAKPFRKSYHFVYVNCVYAKNYFVRAIPPYNVMALSPGQTITTCKRNISQHCWAQHVACVWPPCCDVLQHVGCCWLNWSNLRQQYPTCRNMVAKRKQHVAPNNVAICCVGMLLAFGRGFRAFTVAAPALWKICLQIIRSFCIFI